MLSAKSRLVRCDRALSSTSPLHADPEHRLVIETTSEKLARRLGRAVNKACGGTLDIRFSHVDKLVRVYWQREAVGSET